MLPEVIRDLVLVGPHDLCDDLLGLVDAPLGQPQSRRLRSPPDEEEDDQVWDGGGDDVGEPGAQFNRKISA